MLLQAGIARQQGRDKDAEGEFHRAIAADPSLRSQVPKEFR
jgi:hypothetical protein